MPDPIHELTSLLERRMRQHAASAVRNVPLTLGTVTLNGIKLDAFKHEIREYMQLAGTQQELVQGDRVLLAPIEGGRVFVLLGKVVA